MWGKIKFCSLTSLCYTVGYLAPFYMETNSTQICLIFYKSNFEREMLKNAVVIKATEPQNGFQKTNKIEFMSREICLEISAGKWQCINDRI